MAASYDVPKRIGTKDYIALCFKEMLKTRPFDSISVLELAEVCQLSRTSFYRHFSDKYAVLAWIFKMQLDEIDIEAGGFSSRNLKILKLMAENKNISATYSRTTRKTGSQITFIRGAARILKTC